MIIGIGSDIIEISRIREALLQNGERFLKKVYTAKEQETAEGTADPAASYAKRWAAKEAFAKAIGTGFRSGISLKDIEVINDANGKPALKITGQALCYLHTLHNSPVVHVTLSDCKSVAQAFVVISHG